MSKETKNLNMNETMEQNTELELSEEELDIAA